MINMRFKIRSFIILFAMAIANYSVVVQRILCICFFMYLMCNLVYRLPGVSVTD